MRQFVEEINNFFFRKANNCDDSLLAKDIKQDSESYYAYTRSKTKLKEKVGPFKNGSGRTVTKDGQAADMCNLFFSLVFHTEGDKQHTRIGEFIQG